MAWVNLLTVGSPYTYTLNSGFGFLEISGGYLQNSLYPTEFSGYPDDEGDYGYESSQVATDESLTISVPEGTNVRITRVNASGSSPEEFLLITSADEATNGNLVGFNASGNDAGYAGTDLYTVPIELATSGGEPYMRFFVSHFLTGPVGTSAFRLLIEVETEDFDEFWTDEINATETL